MARWKVEADKEAETAGGGGGNKFPPAPRGFYEIQVADYTDGETKDSGRPKVDLMCEIRDDAERRGSNSPEFGKRAYVTVTMIPKGEKGHGILVHSLHAFGLAHDGNLDFDTNEFQGKKAWVLLGVESREKVKNGRTFVNEVNVVEALYTENYPMPDAVPEPPKPRAKAPAAAAGGPKVSAAGQGVLGRKTAGAGKARSEQDLDEVPF
mgnify:CR=1 FL=1